MSDMIESEMDEEILQAKIEIGEEIEEFMNDYRRQYGRSGTNNGQAGAVMGYSGSPGGEEATTVDEGESPGW